MLQEALDGLEAAPVHLRDAMPHQSPAMQGRAVALVHCEAILRILLVQFGHQPVPSHFSNDRRSGNDEASTITSDNCFAWMVCRQLRRHVVPVNQHLGNSAVQAAHRARHGLQGGTQDVGPVDALVARRGDAPAHGGVAREHLVHLLALLRAELLRVGNAPPQPACARAHRHGGCHYRPRPGTTAGLVDAHNEPATPARRPPRSRQAGRQAGRRSRTGTGPLLRSAGHGAAAPLRRGNGHSALV
mmetsp:Transcript_20933/g.57973  ORF Transcript_20933/g.57973 Transcript_20933/m.57973 type:complete len:244 (-) Transcript_20933:35-766(-)